MIKREEDGEPVPAEGGSRAENATTPEVYQDEETGDGRTPDTTEMEFAAEEEQVDFHSQGKAIDNDAKERIRDDY